MSKAKMEELASKVESKIPNLAKALRSEDLQQSIADMELFDNWIRCKTSVPKDEQNVLVTDGKDVWIGDYNKKRNERDGKWALVYNGCTPFDSSEIVAWTYLPTVLPGLFERDSIKFIAAIDTDSFNYFPKQVIQFDIEMNDEEIDGFDNIEDCQKECDRLNSL